MNRVTSIKSNPSSVPYKSQQCENCIHSVTDIEKMDVLCSKNREIKFVIPPNDTHRLPEAQWARHYATRNAKWGWRPVQDCNLFRTIFDTPENGNPNSLKYKRSTIENPDIARERFRSRLQHHGDSTYHPNPTAERRIKLDPPHGTTHQRLTIQPGSLDELNQKYAADIEAGRKISKGLQS